MIFLLNKKFILDAFYIQYKLLCRRAIIHQYSDKITTSCIAELYSKIGSNTVKKCAYSNIYRQ